MKQFHLLLLLLAVAIALAATKPYWWGVTTKVRGGKTVNDRLVQYGNQARSRLAPHFAKARFDYPPRRVVFVGIKNTNRLQIYSEDNQQQFRFVAEYPIIGA